MSDLKAVYDIKMNEIPKAAITLHRAFQNDPMMKWLFVTEENYQKKGVLLIETWIKYAVLYGKAFRTENFESIALRKKPGDIKFSFWRLFRSGMLKTPSILGKEGFKRLEQLDEIMVSEKQKNMGDRSFWYCWVLGTDPQYQRQGFGGALMKRTFDMANKDNLPCYLETAIESSKAVHAKQGYKVLSELVLPNSDVTLYSMLRGCDCS